MKTLIRFFERYFEPILIVSGTVVMVGVICLQITLRFFYLSISWAEELARYLFVWVIHLSISYAIRGNRHVRVTFLVDKLRGRWHLGQRIFADGLFLLYNVIVLIYGYRLVANSIVLEQIAPAMQVPIALLYASILVSSALGTMRLLASIRAQLKTVKGIK